MIYKLINLIHIYVFFTLLLILQCTCLHAHIWATHSETENQRSCRLHINLVSHQRLSLISSLIVKRQESWVTRWLKGLKRKYSTSVTQNYVYYLITLTSILRPLNILQRKQSEKGKKSLFSWTAVLTTNVYTLKPWYKHDFILRAHK